MKKYEIKKKPDRKVFIAVFVNKKGMIVYKTVAVDEKDFKECEKIAKKNKGAVEFIETEAFDKYKYAIGNTLP